MSSDTRDPREAVLERIIMIEREQHHTDDPSEWYIADLLARLDAADPRLAMWGELVEALLQIQWETNPDRMRKIGHIPNEERIHTTALRALTLARALDATNQGGGDA